MATQGSRHASAEAMRCGTGLFALRPSRRRGESLVARSRRPRRPFSRPESEYTREANLLSQSLFSRMTGELPEDGEFLTETEAKCDPMERFCSDPYYVYEATCRQCNGTGSVRSAGHLITCLDCNGLGMVRHVTTRFFPGEVAEAQTVARSQGGQPDPGTSKGPGDSIPTMPRKPPSFYKPRKPRGAAADRNGT